MNTWTPLTPVDIAEIKSVKFSQAETSYITGLSTERLLTWHKLNLIPEPRSETGRGFRRKYNLHQLCYLSLMRILSKRGFLVKDAARTAEILTDTWMLDAFDFVCAAQSPGNSYPVTIVVYDRAEQEGHETYACEIFSHGETVKGDDPQTAQTLYQWLTEEAVSNAIIIAPGELGLNLLLSMQEVIAGRDRSDFKEALREYLLSFKRHKPEPKGPRKIWAEAWQKAVQSK